MRTERLQGVLHSRSDQRPKCVAWNSFFLIPFIFDGTSLTRRSSELDWLKEDNPAGDDIHYRA